MRVPIVIIDKVPLLESTPLNSVLLIKAEMVNLEEEEEEEEGMIVGVTIEGYW